jgi:organic radical activating enzyme
MTRTASKDSLHLDLSGKNILESDDPRFKAYRQAWEENPARLAPGEFPLHLDIEVTSLCNLSCSFCATTYSKNRISNGYMDPELVRRILDEGAEHGLCACKFNFRGEPLLHPGLPEFVAYAKRKGLLDVFFNTNATLLDENKARALIDSGLDRLTVSFEGFTREVYEKYRRGARFDTVVANVTRLRELRERLGSSTPKIRVQGVLVPEMEGRIEEYVRFWSPVADQVSYNAMLDNVPGRIPPSTSTWICPFPYQRMMVMWDGLITTCYNDHYGKSAVGRFPDITLRQAWIEGFEPLRRMHLEGRAHELGACGECPLRAKETASER